MNEHQVREIVLGILNKIAPEADLSSIKPDSRFRDQFEFDSIDCLNLMTAIEKEYGIHIREVDYPKLATLNGCIRYLAVE
jgi:acyl carrier protein